VGFPLLAREVAQKSNAGDSRRIGPHNLGIVEQFEDVLLRRRRFGFLLLVLGVKGSRPGEQHNQRTNQSQYQLAALSPICANTKHVFPCHCLSPTVLWHESQKAVLAAWSFANRFGCAEACGW